jgi:hypothetical protein
MIERSKRFRGFAFYLSVLVEARPPLMASLALSCFSTGSPLFLEYLKWIFLLTAFDVFAFILSMILVDVFTGDFECGKFYYMWVCTSNCNSTASVNAICSYYNQSQIPYPGIPACNIHAGERGVDLRFLVSLVGLCMSSLAVLTSFAVAVGVFWSRRRHQACIKYLGCLSLSQMMSNGYFIADSVFNLSNQIIASPSSLQSKLALWLGYFFFLGTLCWHFVLVLVIFSLVSSSERWGRRWVEGRPFFIGCHVVVWSICFVFTTGAFMTGSVGNRHHSHYRVWVT